MRTDPAAELAALRTEVAALRRRLDALESGAGEGAVVSHLPPAAAEFDAIYPAFQDRFRGSEHDVRARLEIYLADVHAADTGRGVIDAGPGRGEWLAMLTEGGLTAVGIEASPSMAAALRDRDLPVVATDAIEYLRAREPGSADVVTAFHVLEHLDLDSVLRLLTAARQALRPGGLLVVETPDPTNLVMGACNFRLDPTHLQPLPPALTEFFLTATGFVDVEVRRLHPKEPVTLEGLRLPGVADDTAELLAAALTKAFFGTQDYAALARTPPPPGPDSADPGGRRQVSGRSGLRREP